MASTTCGTAPNGQPIRQFTLTAPGGINVRLLNYGGILTHIEVPDRTGTMADVVLGFDTPDGYLAGHPYFGATVGRYANRIANARFSLDGTAYTLADNNNGNSLHGGAVGFDKVLWDAQEESDTHVRLTHVSPDGDEGYPGTLACSLGYRLVGSALFIDMEATTDAPTPVNLTNHSYFNLAGHDAGSILDHQVCVEADAYTPVNDALIPTGELRPVHGTALDLRTPQPIGARLADVPGGGYDHNYVLRTGGGWLTRAAHVVEPASGRTLEVLTTEPGIQFYTGNFLDGTLTGKRGAVYAKHAGFCLEPQRFPDSPNQPAFPSCILHPGDTYRHTIVFRFGVA